MKKIILIVAGIVTMPMAVFACLPDDETQNEEDENIRTIFAQGRRARSPHDVHLGDCIKGYLEDLSRTTNENKGVPNMNPRLKSTRGLTRGTTFYLEETSNRKKERVLRPPLSLQNEIGDNPNEQGNH